MTADIVLRSKAGHDYEITFTGDGVNVDFAIGGKKVPRPTPTIDRIIAGRAEQLRQEYSPAHGSMMSFIARHLSDFTGFEVVSVTDPQPVESVDGQQVIH